MLCWPRTYVWNSLIFVLHLPRFLSGIRPLVPHSHLFIYLCTLIWEFTICQVFNADLSKTVDVVRFLPVFPEPSVCLWGFHLPVSICIYFLPKGIFQGSGKSPEQNTQQVLNNDRWELVHKSPYSPFRWDNSEACGSHNFSELPLRIKIQLPRRKWLDKTTFIFCFPFLVSLSYWGSVGSFP